MWKYSARKAQQRALTEVKVRVIPLSPILPVSPALLSTYRPEEKDAEEAQEDLEEEPGVIEKEEEDKEDEEVFEEGDIDIDISKFCSSPPPILSPELVIPPPIGGRVTLEKMYKYMVERNNYTDCLQKQMLKKIEQNKTMLRNLSSISLSAREEMKKIKGMVDEIAGDYRSERLDKRLKKTPEVVRGVREIGIMGVNVGIKSKPLRNPCLPAVLIVR
ncbi:hypothetical protein DFP73DRAFT_553297 [Morchella snyderi]|nr:hypothetical protein DFP73DRAFT_553297 [Morchella snyderi]